MYVYQADLWCDDCATEIIRQLQASNQPNTGDSDDWPQYADEDQSETDCPRHCAADAECVNALVLADGRKFGCLLEEYLTYDAREYVLEAVIRDLAAGRTDSIAVMVWADHYGLQIKPDTFDRWDLLEGAYLALTAYHGGQWSRSYRRLSILLRRWRSGPMAQSVWDLGGNAQGYYVMFAVDALLRG